MDIKIDTRNSSPKIKVQHLPFNIKYDGPARLSSYFVTRKTTQLYEGNNRTINYNRTNTIGRLIAINDRYIQASTLCKQRSEVDC